MKKFPLIAGIILCVLISSAVFCRGQEPSQEKKYIVLAWNDLGMHCYNMDYQDLGILPPYNTIWAQVIKVGEPPEVVVSGIIVEYSFPENTYSAGATGRPEKTNFWKYAKQLFGKDLDPDTGLAGKGLSGAMDPAGDHFEAVGIPLTEYRDQDALEGADKKDWERHPYQLCEVVARDKQTGVELCRTTTVAPVSSELNCALCHSDSGRATVQSGITPQGRTGANIVALHDKLNIGEYKPPLSSRRPVLCGECHQDNAIGTKGKQGLPSLSNALHARHKFISAETPGTAGCYSCHPGNRTQCLRDTMAGNYNLNCTHCHGDMLAVSKNKQPWLIEPRCDKCHGSGYAPDKPLYKHSKGSTGIYCAGCHDSPHAIEPSREKNDQIKFLAWQGHAGTLRDCAVCHGAMAKDRFTH
jgi:hypothetical protein